MGLIHSEIVQVEEQLAATKSALDAVLKESISEGGPDSSVLMSNERDKDTEIELQLITTDANIEDTAPNLANLCILITPLEISALSNDIDPLSPPTKKVKQLFLKDNGPVENQPVKAKTKSNQKKGGKHAGVIKGDSNPTNYAQRPQDLETLF